MKNATDVPRTCEAGHWARRNWRNLNLRWFELEVVAIVRKYDGILDVRQLRRLLKEREYDLRDARHFLGKFCSRHGVRRDDLDQPKCWRHNSVWNAAEDVERAQLEIALIRLRIARIETLAVIYGPVPKARVKGSELSDALTALLAPRGSA